MGIDDRFLYEQFVAARLKAVELTDAFRQVAADDPARPFLWDGVVRQTEHARCLLESWLQSAPSSGDGSDRSGQLARRCVS